VNGTTKLYLLKKSSQGTDNSLSVNYLPKIVILSTSNTEETKKLGLIAANNNPSTEVVEIAEFNTNELLVVVANEYTVTPLTVA